MRCVMVTAIILLAVIQAKSYLAADTFVDKTTGASFDGYATSAQRNELTKVYRSDGTSSYIDLTKYTITENDRGKPYGAPALSPIGWLGITFESVESVKGVTVLVTDVDAQGPAAIAGIQRGDIVGKFNGKKVVDLWDFIHDIRCTHPFSKAILGIQREGKSLTVEVVVGDGRRGTCVYPIDITGPILSQRRLAEFIRKQIGQARLVKARYVIITIDSPGGEIDEAKAICNMLSSCGIPTVAVIKGKKHGALSAAAWIALSCDHIFIEKRGKIGAATPYRLDAAGNVEVEEKMKSALRAEFRALAEAKGRPGIIVEAMIDKDVEVVEVDGERGREYLSGDEAREKARLSSGKMRLVRTVSERGKILTATPEEACSYGIAESVVDDAFGALRALNLDHPILDGSSFDSHWVAARKFEGMRKEVNSLFDQATKSDPARSTYYVYTDGPTRGNFVDNGRQWQEKTNGALALVDKCSAKVAEMDDLVTEFPYIRDWGFHVEQRAEFMKALSAYREYLVKNYNRTNLNN